MRTLGKTDFVVSEISLGTWQLGGTWGSGFDDRMAEKILNEARELGVNFLDTADVYENGRSEEAIGKFLKKHHWDVKIATKCGRQISPHINEGYTVKALRSYVEESLRRMQMDCIDLIQLHCPPTEVYYRPEIFGLFDDLKKEGKIHHLGVSVEKVEEAMKAIEFDNVSTVQIIFNIFRQRPKEKFFKEAIEKNVGVIARVPLASGLLTGKFHLNTHFESGDHRHGNRNGEWFDKGETFAGVPFEVGLQAVERLKSILPPSFSMVDLSISWILSHEAISCVIPGASRSGQFSVVKNAPQPSSLPKDVLDQVENIYDEYIKPHVHPYW